MVSLHSSDDEISEEEVAWAELVSMNLSQIPSFVSQFTSLDLRSLFSISKDLFSPFKVKISTIAVSRSNLIFFYHGD